MSSFFTATADGSTVIQTNRYDGLHRRVSRESNTTGVRHFYWNESWQCVEERMDAGTTADRQYVWHPYYIDALAISYNSSGTAHYYVQDGNFNVTAAMDSSGAVVERYSYTPYGVCIVLNADFTLDSSSGGDGLSDIANEFTYTGRRLDVETGLYQYRHRYYHAQFGRFVNRDPIGYEDGENLYRAYFAPEETDPMGLLAFRKDSKPTFNNCGGLKHIARWMTEGNEKNGIIIQLVCYSETIQPCETGKPIDCKSTLGKGAGGMNQLTCSTQCYYEYWTVGNSGAGLSQTDTFAFPNCLNSIGYHAQTGVGIFVSNKWLKDNNFYNQVYDGSVFGTGANGVARAGGLPSACSDNPQAEAFWAKAASAYKGIPTWRFSFTAWDCCCKPRKKLSSSFVSPEK